MLTDVAIKALKAESKPLKRADGGGLFILVNPDGSKAWRLAYRLGGKQKLLSGGVYPKVRLREARAWREKVRAQLALGIDPSAARRAEKREQEAEVRRAATNRFEVSPRNGWRRASCPGRRVTRRWCEGDLKPTSIPYWVSWTLPRSRRG